MLPITSKPALFDIGIAGPFAGFAIAVPALFLGLALSRVVDLPPVFSGAELGEPLLFKAAAWLVLGPVPDHQSINLHPMAFAAWFGMLATALNLIPIGQFDGGHISYAVFGRNSIWVTRAAVVSLVSLVLYSYSLAFWTLLAIVLLFLFGWRHPPTWDEDVPLDRRRLLLAVVASAYFTLLGAYLQSNLIPYGIQHLGLPEEKSGYLFFVAAIGIVIGAGLAGKVSGRNIEFGVVPLGSLALTVASILLFAAPPHFTSVIPLLLLAVLGAGLFIIPLDSFIQYRAPKDRVGATVAASGFLSWVGVLVAAGLVYLNGALHISAGAGFLLMGSAPVQKKF
jgi:hypothetical protein